MQQIRAFKNHQLIPINLSWREEFVRPKQNDRLPADRIVGIDTESFSTKERATGLYPYESDTTTLSTAFIPLDFCDPTTSKVLETHGCDIPLEMCLEYLAPLYKENEICPSETKQRRVRARKDGSMRRDGRRQFIMPVALIFHNLEYDFGRLVRNHPQFKRVILAGAESAHVQVGRFDVEISQLKPYGSAPSFEFYVRWMEDGERKIMRLIGRDLFGYLKLSLDEIGTQFVGNHKTHIDEALFDRLFESFSDEELLMLQGYAAQDAKVTREAYELLIHLLTSIDVRVICPNGLPPKSASGAAARMAFALASLDEWKRPSRLVMEYGAKSYAGARMIHPTPGYYEDIAVYDFSSMYPHKASLLPDPCTCIYQDIQPGPYIHEQWRGQFGNICVSGYEMDDRFPSLRVHDSEAQRLRYIYGKFENVWTTIPEAVIGAEKGTLQIDSISDGIHMVGKSEYSFLKLFCEKVYTMKEDARANNNHALYLLTKLLLNSFCGKLAEITMPDEFLDTLAADVIFPDVPALRDDFKNLMQTYIDKGSEALYSIASELRESNPDVKPLLFREVVLRYKGTPQAGQYYLPMHAAQITGMGSAYLGVAAYCTNAIAGNTDSLFIQEGNEKGLDRAREIVQAAGYDFPAIDSGMGAFRKEIGHANGYLLKGNLYSLVYLKDENGVPVEHYKQANHGLVNAVDMRKPGHERDLHGIIRVISDKYSITYKTRKTPLRLRLSLMLDAEPGIFASHRHTFKLTLDPHQYIDDRGLVVWKETELTAVWRKIVASELLEQLEDNGWRILFDSDEKLLLGGPSWVNTEQWYRARDSIRQFEPEIIALVKEKITV